MPIIRRQELLRWLGVSVAVLFCFSVPVGVLKAQYDCSQSDPCSGKSGDDKVSCYTEVVSVCGKNSETLASTINYLDNQMKLKTLQIASTRGLIAQLSSEIDDLANEVDRLQSALNKESELVLKRVPEAYKRESTSQFGQLFFSTNIADFVSRVQYASEVQKHDISLLFQLKATQTNFSERIQMREQKRKEQDEAKARLERQTVELSQQKQEKNTLLAQTQGNEKKYAQLLAEARAQIAATQRYVSNLGGATVLSNQTVCNDWGCYYNQRDSQWASQALGSSNLSVMEYGCLVSSVAMVATHYRKDIKPSDIAANPSAFFSPDRSTALLWNSINVKGISIVRSQIGVGGIDRELAAGRPVIVGLYAGPAHFIVLKSGSGGNYVMNDPFLENGHDVAFTSKYSVGNITEASTVSVN